MNPGDIATLDWDKGLGLLPAVVQDSSTGTVLMVGFMNSEALQATLQGGRVVFFSRSRNRLWLKGETSGHFLDVVAVTVDCDRDSLLIQARPAGPVCHTGEPTCFHGQPATNASGFAFLDRLEQVIAQRMTEQPEGSYTARLVSQGGRRVAQKVGEEGLEVALAAVAEGEAQIVTESADLLYHLLLLLKSRNLSIRDVVQELEQRHAAKA